MFRANALVLIKGRSQIDVGYTRLYRSKNLSLDNSLVFGDTAFYVGADLGVKFNVDYLKLTWKYSFFNETNWNAGLSFGFRVLSFRADLTARTNNRGDYSAHVGIWAPAPVLGVHGSAYLTERLMGRYDLQFFQVNIKGIRFKVIETNAALQYFFTKNIGAGIEYATNSYQLRELPLADDFKGKILFDFSGFNLFLAARF